MVYSHIKLLLTLFQYHKFKKFKFCNCKNYGFYRKKSEILFINLGIVQIGWDYLTYRVFQDDFKNAITFVLLNIFQTFLNFECQHLKFNSLG